MHLSISFISTMLWLYRKIILIYIIYIGGRSNVLSGLLLFAIKEGFGKKWFKTKAKHSTAWSALLWSCGPFYYILGSQLKYIVNSNGYTSYKHVCFFFAGIINTSKASWKTAINPKPYFWQFKGWLLKNLTQQSYSSLPEHLKFFYSYFSLNLTDTDAFRLTNRCKL